LEVEEFVAEKSDQDEDQLEYRRELAASYQREIKPLWYTKRWDFMLKQPTRTWQAQDIRDMTGSTEKNLFFPKNKPINTLVLDAHISLRHLNVRNYASKAVWDAAQTDEEVRLLGKERNINAKKRFQNLSTTKRKLGEKKKRNKKRLQSAALA
jgi:hypothetical protein